jgi:hypothetical protein
MFFSRLRLRISHTAFCIGFCAGLFAICNAITFDHVARWFRVGEVLDLSALLAYLLAALCIFTAFFTLLAHRWTIKPLAILLTACSATVTYFIAKYGVAIDSSMIRNAIHTDAVEVGQLLSVQMIPFVGLLMILPACFILLADITFAGSARYLLGSLKVIGIAIVVALGSLYAEYHAIFRAGNVSNKYIVYQLVPVNFISGSISVASKALRPYLRRQQKEIAFPARVTAPGNLVVVLAVGESSRRKNFSLYGYGRRETNPRLEGNRRPASAGRRGHARLHPVRLAEDLREAGHQADHRRVARRRADGLLRELHAVRQLRRGRRDRGRQLRARQEMLRRGRVAAAREGTSPATSRATASWCCTSAAAATGRSTRTGTRLNSSNSSRCAPTRTWPTGARSKSCTTRTTTPSCT